MALYKPIGIFIFPAQWFYGLLRALPGEPGFLATVACASSRRLDTSVGVSERHDLTVRLSAIRQLRCSVHRIPPSVDDVAQRPSFGTGQRWICI